VTQLTSFYHCYAAGDDWETPVEEHLSALARVGYDSPFHVGLVGSEPQRADALDFITARRRVDRTYTADTGWEQVTLRKIREHARKHPDGLTLYAHTKGASRPSRLQDAWRRSMTCALLGALDVHAQTLSMIYQAVGCHWLTPGAHAGGVVDSPGFGGNFWLARNDFLATLPPVRSQTRHDAEAWIGSGDQPPVVLDLNPGWPGTVPWFTRIGWPR
jgi:hypothetical protein